MPGVYLCMGATVINDDKPREVDEFIVEDLNLSFDDFYRATYPGLVRALVVGLGGYERGVDAADEAMTRAFPKWTEIRHYDNPEGWCFRVGLNYGRSILRRLGRRPTITGEAWTEANVPNPELWSALQRLDRDLRDVIVCRLLLELSVRETATHLRISEGTVKSRLHRAREQLKNELTGTTHD